MAHRPRPPRRPVVGSRNPTARPRSVAGRRPGADETAGETPPEATVDDPPDHAPEDPPDETPDDPDETPDDPDETPDDPDDLDERAGDRARRLVDNRRATVALVAALVLLIGGAAAEGWYLWLRDEPVVSAQRPVVTGEIAHRAAVEAASQSTAEILTYGYQDFDAQIEAATSTMTESFAQQFRDTAADVRAEFIANRTEQEVEIVAASVVQASSKQVRALIFLDQYVARAGKGTAVTPYRALVTVVHTESGWLVSDIETR